MSNIISESVISNVNWLVKYTETELIFQRSPGSDWHFFIISHFKTGRSDLRVPHDASPVLHHQLFFFKKSTANQRRIQQSHIPWCRHVCGRVLNMTIGISQPEERSCSVVWCYGSFAYSCISCQMAAGWNDCGIPYVNEAHFTDRPPIFGLLADSSCILLWNCFSKLF